MNWRALTDLVVWTWFQHEPDRFAAMRVLVKQAHTDPAIGRPLVRFGAPKWSKFLLLRDAKGNSLMQRAWSRLGRAA